MNERQWNIVKIMQACGIRAKRFAKATRASESIMLRAYNTASYSQFEEFAGYDEVMEEMDVHPGK